MNLFKLCAVLGLLLSANLMAVGPLKEEGEPHYRILRGVKVQGQEHVDIKSEDLSIALPRLIEGRCGYILSSMDWSIYSFQTPHGVFWTESATQELQDSAFRKGVPLDFDPNRVGFVFSLKVLKTLKIKAGNYESTLLAALVKHKVDEKGILVITP